MTSRRNQFPAPCEPAPESSTGWREPWNEELRDELRKAVADADRGDWQAAYERLIFVMLECAEAVKVCDSRLRGEIPRCPR